MHSKVITKKSWSMTTQMKLLKKKFKLVLNRYKYNFETSMRVNNFIFDYVHFIYYKCHKIYFGCGGSCLESPDW